MFYKHPNAARLVLLTMLFALSLTKKCFASDEAQVSSPHNIIEAGIFDYGFGLGYETRLSGQSSLRVFAKDLSIQYTSGNTVGTDNWFGAGMGARYYFGKKPLQGLSLGLQVSREWVQVSANDLITGAASSPPQAELDLLGAACLLSYRWIFFHHLELSPSLGLLHYSLLGSNVQVISVDPPSGVVPTVEFELGWVL